MGLTLFNNVRILDGTGGSPVSGSVLVDGKRIKSVGRGNASVSTAGATVIDAAGATLMPGMLTPEEMTRLSEAKGAPFDRLFLELMIKHHEGALDMVKTLFSQPGAAQDADIFAFASDVEADQSIEIARMRSMLAAWK